MADWELRVIFSIRQYLTDDAAKTLVLILSGPVYITATVCLRESLAVSYRKAPDSSKCKCSLNPHVLPEENFPNHSQKHYIGGQFLIASSANSLACVTTPSLPPPHNALPNFSKPAHHHAPFGLLQTRGKLSPPGTNIKYSGQRSFSYQGPVIWNDLSITVRHSQNIPLIQIATENTSVLSKLPIYFQLI